jgi:hypothetical protein
MHLCVYCVDRRPTPTTRYQAFHPHWVQATPRPRNCLPQSLSHPPAGELGCDATSSSSTRMSRRWKTSRGIGIPKEECHNEKRIQTMTILGRECQGKAACLPRHCNWPRPRPTPHRLGPGKPDSKACPDPFKVRSF